MNGHDDDLGASPLWDALRAPGTPEELAGEQAALQAFRRAAAERRRRRTHRLGAGGAGLLLFVVAGGGAAAAVTGRLPDPVQNAVQDAVHAVIPDVAPSRPKPARRTASHLPPATPPVTPSPAPSPQRTTGPGSGEPSRPSAATVPAPAPATVPAPAADPAPSAAPSPTASPTPAPTLVASTSAKAVPVHGDVVVTGRLVRGGVPVEGQVVYLGQRLAGESSWTRVGHATTDADGRVRVVAHDLRRNASYRLASQGIASGAHPVTVLPAVTVRVTEPGPRRRVLDVTTDGAVAGDAVQLLRYDGSTWRVVQKGSLDSSAATSFTVAAPPSGQTVRYRVRVVATTRHGTGLRGTTLQG